MSQSFFVVVVTKVAADGSIVPGVGLPRSRLV